jgi:hypothetical protein
LIRFFHENPRWAVFFFAATLLVASVITASRG